MSFDPQIPQPNDFLSDSQAEILNNFQSLDTIFGINHYEFSSAINSGKHSVIQMPENLPPATGSDEGALYTAVGLNPGETNLWFRAENSGGGGGFEYQLTHVDSTHTAEFATNTTYETVPVNFNGGWTFLPGGLILQYGLATISNFGGDNVVPFPFPFPTAVFSVVNTGVTSANSTNTTLIKAVANASFTIRNTASSSVSAMYWIAIGK